MNPLVEAVDVHRSYPLDGVVVHALRGVSFKIYPGEYVAILGPSGSGKSTLLHLLGALDRPTSGEVRFDGNDIRRMSDVDLATLRNRRIGLVFQSFHLMPRLTALENVALPLIYRGASHRARLQRAKEALEAVGLGERLHHRPNQLSGGQQQRVAIARALVGEPRLLLADEPTGNLDTVTGAEVMTLLSQLHAETGMALVVITHDERVAERAQRRIVIQDGLLLDDPRPDLYADLRVLRPLRPRPRAAAWIPGLAPPGLAPPALEPPRWEPSTLEPRTSGPGPHPADAGPHP